MLNGDRDLQLWNAAAGRYAEAAGGSFFRRLSPFLQQALGDVAGMRLLDLGCGHGWLSGRLHAAGAKVTGIDGSTELLRRAAAAHPDVTFEVHDLTSGLPRPLQIYDSQHTAVLREAGLIHSNRVGKAMLHTITPLGAALLNADTM